jgi:hypothetical protein
MFESNFKEEDWGRLDQAINWLNESIVQSGEAAHIKDVLLQNRKNVLGRYGLNPQLVANVERREQYAISKPGRSYTVALYKALVEGGKIPAVSEFSFAHWLITGQWLFPAEPPEESAEDIAKKIKDMDLSADQKTAIIRSLME